MSVKERLTIAGVLKQEAEPEKLGWPEERTRFEKLSQSMPPVKGFEAEPSTVGGINGEWIRATGVFRSDAALLYLHGGGYVIGSPKSYRHMLGPMSADSNLPMFAADYRLAPENPFPAAVDDAVAAYEGLLASGIAAGKIAVAGDSAGAGLAIAMLIAARVKGVPMPSCAVAISPWVDMSKGGEAFRARAKRDPQMKSEILDEMAAAYLCGADPKSALASPLYANLKGLPPLLIQTGTEEALKDDAMALKQRAEEVGVEVSFETWAGMIHVWHIFHPILPEGRDAIARVGDFLKQHIP